MDQTVKFLRDVKNEKPHHLPTYFTELLNTLGEGITDAKDYCVLLIHTLMKEIDYMSEEQEIQNISCREEPMVKISYKHPNTKADATYNLVICRVASPKHLDVHGLVKTKDDQTEGFSISLKTDDYIDIRQGAPPDFRNLAELSRQFYDQIGLPMRGWAETALNLQPTVGWPILPYDVQLKILEHCSALELCRLACTCKELNNMANMDVYWKRLYEKNFGTDRNNSTNNNTSATTSESWKEKYKREVEAQRRVMPPVHAPLTYDRFYSAQFPPIRPEFWIDNDDFDFDILARPRFIGPRIFPSLPSVPALLPRGFRDPFRPPR